jgi:hypothetical protein
VAFRIYVLLWHIIEQEFYKVKRQFLNPECLHMRNKMATAFWTDSDREAAHKANHDSSSDGKQAAD